MASSVHSAQCAISSASASGGVDFVFVTRSNGVIGIGLLNRPEIGKRDPSVVWATSELPAQLKKEMEAKYEIVKSLPVDPVDQWQHLASVGPEVAYHELCFGVAFTTTAILWSSSSVIVVFDRANGSVLSVIESGISASRFWADEADVTISSASQQWSMRSKRGGSFFADCHTGPDRLLVYFNGAEFIILTIDTKGLPAIQQRISWDTNKYSVAGPPSNCDALIVSNNGQVEIKIKGIVYLT